MKKFLNLALIALYIITCSNTCNGDKNQAPGPKDDFVTATIGTTSFVSSGTNDVYLLVSPDPTDTSKLELTITGQSENKTLTLAIHNYTKGVIGTYRFDTGVAIGGYNTGSGVDDPLVSGTITITNNTDKLIQGTFSSTTQSGISISNGNFEAFY